MGLFSKKDPCAICGGQVKGLFAHKISGQHVCSSCYGEVDLPDGCVKQMSLADFRAYMAFREENSKLKQQFNVTDTIDFGILDTKFMIDVNNRLLCMDKQLEKTIFTGDQIKGFVIREDSTPIFEGSAEGLVRYNSGVLDRVMGMSAQFNIMALADGISKLAGRNDGGNSRDITEPFEKFVIDIYFDHPYWQVFTADMGGPVFNNENPDVTNYLREYNEGAMTMDHLAQALMAVAFPNGAVAAATAPEADVTEQLVKFKELLDKGIITEEEFAAKKRQLLGI